MIDCACGKTHDSNYKILVDIDDETGEEFYSWALCEEHARHEPCRDCLAREAQKAGYDDYQSALRDNFKRLN